MTVNATQRVNEAVAICVRRLLDTTRDVGDRTSLGREIGKRIQGTYGAELRTLAVARPELSAQQLYEIVILAAEFPWDAGTAKESAQQAFGGDRDKARERRYGPLLDEAVPNPTPPDLIPSLIAAIKSGDIETVRELTESMA